MAIQEKKERGQNYLRKYVREVIWSFLGPTDSEKQKSLLSLQKATESQLSEPLKWQV